MLYFQGNLPPIQNWRALVWITEPLQNYLHLLRHGVEEDLNMNLMVTFTDISSMKLFVWYPYIFYSHNNQFVQKYINEYHSTVNTLFFKWSNLEPLFIYLRLFFFSKSLFLYPKVQKQHEILNPRDMFLFLCYRNVF